MGNLITSGRKSSTAEVIMSDGSVHELDNTLTVAELMLDHPQQVVVEFRPDLLGKRLIPLSADKKLETKKIYLMLPVRGGKPASLTSEEMKHVLLSAISVLRSRSFITWTRFLPMFARICPAGFDEVGKRFGIEKKELNVVEKPPEILPENFENMPEYLNRQISGKGWKPSLDTITEKKVDNKQTHWLFILK